MTYGSYKEYNQQLYFNMATRWRERVALVTGASSGIGYATAKWLAENGMIVYGAARNIEQIKLMSRELDKNECKGKVIPYRCDITDDTAVITLFAAIKSGHQGVDVLINNAGMNRKVNLLDGTTEQWKEILNLNVVALCFCTKLAVASMRERGVDDGHIINLGSILGHKVLKPGGTHFYACTKFAVNALTEGLRVELREAKSHIRASTISPGLVESDFMYRSSNDPEFVSAVYSSFEALKAADIAESIWHMINAPRHVEINDILIRPTEEEQ